MADDALIALAAEVGASLKQRGWMLALAESCTGGGIAEAITAVPGSSAWFDRGFVTYSNASKIDMLGVQSETLDAHGAVSREVVLQMAQGALRNSQAQVSIAVSGIAGPDGGTPEKPVGTVWLAWAVEDGEMLSECHRFDGSRREVRYQSALVALERLLAVLR
ncbi:nicotinamide-nucleotide amidase [Novimethylophilus kurashikiensis]|uniref:Nicotinamide-nucleotide amidase n=1 Tax=Novimethylophilus kurashikiensis TaxID=1825523 RepID=A0A2R5FB94_9PROT|nr:CinA family protein [Novimethylophilus kurashikiensis]GBG14173.1 nicotinamide-nucleotide amidase [Novimethylophilus kurashikiensis]